MVINKAREILKRRYGYSTFKKGQEKIIDSILRGHDTLGVMPTGGGKSVCFQIPALLFPGLTLVFSPLISLMKDQVDALAGLGIPGTFINSSLRQEKVEDRLSQASRGRFKLLYVAPERLESGRFLTLMRSLPVSLVAVDEAHCVSQWGHDFRQSYLGISGFIEGLPKRPAVAAFTATATEEVRADIIKLLHLRDPQVFITGFDRENLSFSVVRGENKRDFLLGFLENRRGQSGIIYAATRKEVDNLNDLLQKKGFPAGKYHAGLSDEERTTAQEKFLYDEVRVMVATNAFGMGIDKSDVRFVVHYNMPKNIEAYYQEAGRAGRDDEPGECVILFSPQDIHVQKFLIEQSQLAQEGKTSEYKRLQAMVDYCHTPNCLRRYILRYFGEENVSEECGNCGNCSDNRELADITIDAQKVFSCILRMKEQFGVTLVAEVLKGSDSKKVRQYGFSRLSTYGLMKERTLKQITDMINVLIADGYISLSEGQYPVAKLRLKAYPVLKGQEKVWQKVRKREKAAAAGDPLFELLRRLRKEIAQREKVPPYIIFADSTLREMSERHPPDQKSMLSIKGVGQAKLERYGGLFLDLIKEYCAERGIPMGQAGPSARKEREEKLPSHIATLNIYRECRSVGETARKRDLKPVTVQDHLVRCGLEGHEIDWDEFIPREYEELILQKIKVHGAEKLRPIKDELPEEVDYLAIKAVLCKYRLYRRGTHQN